jgi:hypothetical protein
MVTAAPVHSGCFFCQKFLQYQQIMDVDITNSKEEASLTRRFEGDGLFT